MVTPVYSAKQLLQQPGEDKEERERAVVAMVERVTSFFPKLHALVIGPGLGRDPWVLEATWRVILEARRAAMPLGAFGCV